MYLSPAYVSVASAGQSIRPSRRLSPLNECPGSRLKKYVATEAADVASVAFLKLNPSAAAAVLPIRTWLAKSKKKKRSGSRGDTTVLRYCI